MEQIQINLALKVHRLHDKKGYQISEILRAKANRKRNIHGVIKETEIRGNF